MGDPHSGTKTKANLSNIKFNKLGLDQADTRGLVATSLEGDRDFAFLTIQNGEPLGFEGGASIQNG